MSSKRKKAKDLGFSPGNKIAEYIQSEELDANRKFTDQFGHVYHGLTFGDPDGSEDDHLEILFSRIDPHVVLPREFLVMMLTEGWNGELSVRNLDCDGDHDDNNIN